MEVAFMYFYTTIWPKNDPCGQKHVGLLNTKTLVVLAVLIGMSTIRKRKGTSVLKTFNFH
jgi:hypothetical protein